MVRLNVGWLGIAGGSVEGSGFATGSVSDAIDKGLPRWARLRSGFLRVMGRSSRRPH
ncbi:hypothetical protein ABIA35_003906 [Catenulispora sp. MAP12-49]